MISDGKKSLDFENYPLWWVMVQNLLFVIYFTSAFLGMAGVSLLGFPIVSISYVLFVIVMLLFVLRKHLCTNCYYYGKVCNTGWGKLAALLFEKESGNYKLGVKLAGITWGLITVIPILVMIILLIMNFSMELLITFVLFLVLTPVVMLYHKRSCFHCKMKYQCPATMAKIKNEGS